MSVEIHFVRGSYCAICDHVFDSEELRSTHVQFTPAHPACKKCNRRFPDKHNLRNHFILSNEHHYCSSCRAHFESAAGLKAHRKFSTAHRDIHDFTLPIVDEDVERWEEILGAQFFPKCNERFERHKLHQNPVEEEEMWTEDYEADLLEENGSADPDLLNEEDQSSDDGEECPLTDCPICLGPYADQVSATKCGHLFCTPCIEGSLVKRSVCPVCDRPAHGKSLRNLYLF